MHPAPDSLISAAKKLADAARLPWPVVQKSYRALQAADVLPISRGRAIWYAHPNMIGELLIAVALGADENVSEQVLAFHAAKADDGCLFREELSRALIDTLAASDLDGIVFEVDTSRVMMVAGGKATAFTCDPALGAGDVNSRPLIQRRAVVPGEVIRALQASVTWRTPDLPPHGSGVLDEAE